MTEIPSMFIEKPKRPMSAYMIWLNSARKQIEAENPGLKVTELAKKGGQLWMRLKDKSEWEEKAAEAKEQYIKDLESYYNAKMACIKSEVPKRKESLNKFYSQKQYDETEESDKAKETYRHAITEHFVVRKKVKMTDKPRIRVNSAREQIKSENPGTKDTEIAKMGGEMWRSMNDKSAKAAEALEQCTKDLESDEYNEKMPCIKSEASIIKNIIHEGQKYVPIATVTKSEDSIIKNIIHEGQKYVPIATVSKSEDSIIKNIIHEGQKYVPIATGSKVHFHFQTWKLGKERVLLDDSKKIGKKEPMDLIIGHKFKLEVWENIVKMMAAGDVARFQVKRELVHSYPLVSKTLRDLGQEQKIKHSLLYNTESTGYSDLDDLIKNPCDLEFIIEVLKVEDQEEEQDDKNAMKKLLDRENGAS